MIRLRAWTLEKLDQEFIPLRVIRQPTGAAQRSFRPARRIAVDIVKYIFPSDDTTEDVIEANIRTTLAVLDKADPLTSDEATRLRRLLRGYANLKGRLGGNIWQTVFRCWVYPPPVVRCCADECSDVVGTNCNDDLLQEPPNDTISSQAEKICQALGRDLSAGFWVIAMACEVAPDDYDMTTLFSFWQKVVATFRGRLRELHKPLNQVLAFLVRKTPKERLEFLHQINNVGSDIGIKTTLEPPSMRLSRGNLDPALSVDNKMVLAWQRCAPVFSSDFEVYVWEHHKQPPSYESVTIVYAPQNGTYGGEVELLFRSSHSLQLFNHLRLPEEVYSPLGGAVTTYSWSGISELIFTVCAAFRVMIHETKDFASQSLNELRSLKQASRQNPTSDKVRFLLHFEDCRASAQQGVVQGLATLRHFERWADQLQRESPLWDGGDPLSNRFTRLRCDLEFFDQQLTKMGPDIRDLQQMIREHLALNNERRTFILTILAAIFLPLSFVTSLLGMNMNSSIEEGQDGFSGWLNDTIGIITSNNSSTSTVRNQTAAIVSTISTTGPLTWSWKVFAMMSVCLIMTLPLSLTLGSILRLCIQYGTYYIAYWRALATMPAAVLVAVSIVGKYPVLVALRRNEGWYNDLGDMLNDMYLWSGGERVSARFFFAYEGINACLLLFAGIMVYLAWKNRRHRAFWATTIVLAAACFLIDTLATIKCNKIYTSGWYDNDNWSFDQLIGYFPWMALPWLWFALRYFQPWRKKSSARKLQRFMRRKERDW